MALRIPDSSREGIFPICLANPLYAIVKKAIDGAKKGTGSPCSKDSMTVCLGLSESLLLLTAISNALNATGTKKKKKKGKGGKGGKGKGGKGKGGKGKGGKGK